MVQSNTDTGEELQGVVVAKFQIWMRHIPVFFSDTLKIKATLATSQFWALFSIGMSFLQLGPFKNEITDYCKAISGEIRRVLGTLVIERLYNLTLSGWKSMYTILCFV